MVGLSLAASCGLLPLHPLSLLLLGHSQLGVLQDSQKPQESRQGDGVVFSATMESPLTE